MNELDRDLRTIMAKDPASFPTEPTEIDYLNHMNWAIRLFGVSTWKTYKEANWGERSDV